ncbi:MAG: Omp28-related outer membrane protein [Flavobacteriales bacterium]
MKKSLFITNLFLLGSLMGFSQLPVDTTAQNKNVVLEEYTGIYCVYCPDGHARANAIKAGNPNRVVLINVHTGSFAAPTGTDPDYRTSFGTALAAQTGLTGYPSGTVNRHVFSGTTTATSRADWATNSTTILGQASYANIALEGSIDIQSRVLTVNTEVYITGTAPSSLKLNIALSQNNVAGPQTGGANFNASQINANGDYMHGHMLRHLITGQWGDTISTTATGTKISRTYTYTIPADINGVPLVLGDLEIAGFIAEGNQEIITGANGPISFVAPAGVSIIDLSSANATVNPTSYCTASVDPKVTITNNSTVAADTFEVSYQLNGGTPVTQSVYTSLAASASTTITFPSVTLPNGANKITFDCNVSNANTLLEVATGNNASANSEIVTVSSVALTGAIAEQFEGYTYATEAPANSFAINPDGVAAFILNTSNVSTTAPPIGGFGNSDGAFRWRYFSIADGEASSILYDKLSFAGNTNSEIEFDISYAKYNASSNDALEVEISTDCGATWTSVYSKSGTSLSTAPAATTQFYPTSETDWRTETIDLSSYDGQSSVLIKFTGTSNYGNNLYLDNIRIVDAVTSSINENESSTSLNIYPNPSNGMVNLEYISRNLGDITINIINTLGANVYTTNAVSNGSLNKSIDLSQMTKGIYFVNVVSENGTTTKKMIIQ